MIDWDHLCQRVHHHSFPGGGSPNVQGIMNGRGVEFDDPWNGSRVESAVPCDSGFGGLRLGLYGMRAYRDEKRVVESATCWRRLRWGDGGPGV